MATPYRIRLFDLALGIGEAIDLIDPAVYAHHLRVAYTCLRIGQEMSLAAEALADLVYAGLLHDLGALSRRDRLDILSFEYADLSAHGHVGWSLLGDYAPLAGAARLIRNHHSRWKGGDVDHDVSAALPLGSHIIHVADRIVVLVKDGQEILGQAAEIRSRIADCRSLWFHPEVVDAALAVAEKEYFWFELVAPDLRHVLERAAPPSSVIDTTDAILGFTRVLSRIVDFRSPFTATHTSGIVAVARRLASLAGCAPDEQLAIEIGAHLHDLGKLAVPSEILEKPDKLTTAEFNVIRRHPFNTYRILDGIDGFEKVRDIAARHHERLDGSGYPFHLRAEELSIPSRLLAVADVFTALTEDRPYRAGMTEVEALRVVKGQARDGLLDASLVDLVATHFDLVNDLRDEAQVDAQAEFLTFRAGLPGSSP